MQQFGSEYLFSEFHLCYLPSKTEVYNFNWSGSLKVSGNLFSHEKALLKLLPNSVVKKRFSPTFNFSNEENAKLGWFLNKALVSRGTGETPGNFQKRVTQASAQLCCKKKKVFASTEKLK